MSDEIPDNQEIAGEFHLLNQFNFAFQSLFVGTQRILQSAGSLQAIKALAAMGKTLACDLFKIAIGRVAGGHVKMWENVLLGLQFQIAALGDLESAGQRLRYIVADRKSTRLNSSHLGIS